MFIHSTNIPLHFFHIPHIFIEGGCRIPKLLVYISTANNDLVCTPEEGEQTVQ